MGQRERKNVTRRAFFARVAGLASGAFLAGVGLSGCRKEQPAPGEGPATGPKGEAGGQIIGRQVSPSELNLPCDVVVVHGEDPEQLVEAAVAELGGIEKFVKKGDRVCLKPNLAWARTPESGANTNPAIIEATIELVKKAQPKEIVIFEHTRDAAELCWAFSGIDEVATRQGVTLDSGQSESVYQAVDAPPGLYYLSDDEEKERVALDVLLADVIINMPVLKDHSATRLSMGLKNLMGAIFHPERYHAGVGGDPDKGGEELEKRIADLGYLIRPHLTIMDATRVLREGGPKGDDTVPADVVNKVIAGVDAVAVDAMGAEVFGVELAEVPHVQFAAELGLGTADLEELRAASRIKEIELS